MRLRSRTSPRASSADGKRSSSSRGLPASHTRCRGASSRPFHPVSYLGSDFAHTATALPLRGWDVQHRSMDYGNPNGDPSNRLAIMHNDVPNPGSGLLRKVRGYRCLALVVSILVMLSATADGRGARNWKDGCSDGLIVRLPVDQKPYHKFLRTPEGSERWVSPPLFTIQSSMIESAATFQYQVDAPLEARRSRGFRKGSRLSVRLSLNAAGRDALDGKLGDRRLGDSEEYRHNPELMENLQRDLGESGWSETRFAKQVLECNGYALDALVSGTKDAPMVEVFIFGSADDARHFAQVLTGHSHSAPPAAD